MRAAPLGTNVVLDFGLWGTDERSALRWIAASPGVRTLAIVAESETALDLLRVTARGTRTEKSCSDVCTIIGAVDSVVIGSHETKLELVCTDRAADGSAELIRACVRGRGLEAVCSAYDVRYDGLATFFEDLAGSWRGWVGEKTFASLEGHLDLTARHDGGHVVLMIRLRQFEPADWSVETTLAIDPGEDLSAAAGSVRELVG